MRAINSELKLVTDRLRVNKLSLNETKTKCLQTLCKILKLPINKLYLTLSDFKLNEYIQLLQSQSHLGVGIDKTQSWGNQIEVLVN